MQDRYTARRARLTARLKKDGCHAFLVTDFTNVSYLTGFSGDDSYLLVTPKSAVLLSDPRYEEQIAGECPDLPMYIRRSGESMIVALGKVFEEYLGRPAELKLGIEASSVSLELANRLKRIEGNPTLVPLSDCVEQLREIKDRYEIDAMRVAIRIARRGFEIVRNGLLASDSEIDVRNKLDAAMMAIGADDRSFRTIVACGPRAALPHAVPTPQFHVGENELLLIDWGAKKDFYVSDLTRVLITTTKPSTKLKKIYNIVLKAQLAAMEAIRPGVLSKEIDAIARKIITDAGYGKMFGHNLGHGLGMVVHDRGGVQTGNKTVLQPGMVVTVEPGIYIPGWGGIRIEDDVLVTRDGFENLSAGFPKEFDEMIVEL